MLFGEKLKYYRKRKKLTQQELAKMAGMGLNTINNYETGRTYPQKRSTYVLLAEILGVKTEDLRNESDDFFLDAEREYGSRGKKQATELVNELTAMFSGGELDEVDMDMMMRAISDAYWIAKDKNKKYIPKKKD